MKEVYRKFGRVVRRENATLVRVDEAGEAIEDGGLFSAAPIDSIGELPVVDAADVMAAADGITRIIKAPLSLERMLVSEGAAVHELGDRRWSDRARRVHLSIARAPHRVLIDLADFSLDRVERIVVAFAKARSEEPVHRIRLSPAVGAALLPHLLGSVPMQQWAAPVDGKGEWIANMPVRDGVPPNWFRPSYRARPVRAWFHLHVDDLAEIDRELPEAIALLAPIHDRTLRVLCEDRDRAFVSEINVDRVIAAKASADWFPYAAGCFGAAMNLECRIA